MNNVNRKHTALPIAIVLLCVTGLSRAGLAQEISAMQHRLVEGLYPPSSYAMDLFDHFELVADGEFYAIPASTPEELRALEWGEVVVKFRIRKLYKGAAADSIGIQMDMDMLVYPGTSMSRYAKRQQIIAEQDEDLKPIWEEYEAAESAYEAGEIQESEYLRVLGKYSELSRARKRRDGLIGRRRFRGVVHGRTFFDKGGAIRAGEKYLIGVNSIQGSADGYLLTQFGKSRIYWGEMRKHVLSAPKLDNTKEPMIKSGMIGEGF